MAKIVLDDVSNTPNMHVGVNSNSAKIETAFENTVSRDGTGPNHMMADLNMNGYNILNQGNPVVVEGIEWQGDWLASFDYKVGDIVHHPTGTYICIVAHTSGDFPTDLINNKWQLFVPTPDVIDANYTYPDGVERTLQARLEDFVSIKDFGAVGDGVTDNKAAIEAAMAAAAGRKIIVPMDDAGGDYAVTSGAVTLTGVFEYETGTRIYALGSGTVTDQSQFMSFGPTRMGPSIAGQRDIKGLNIRLNSPNSGNASSDTVAYNQIVVASDSMDGTTGGGGTKVNGLYMHQSFGGANAKGGRHTGYFGLVQNSATHAGNPDRNYCALVGQTNALSSDGGTPGAEKGAYFGGNFWGSIAAGVTGAMNVTACEFNSGIFSGGNSKYRSGIAVAMIGDERGTDIDAGIAIYNLTTTKTLKNGIRIGPYTGSNNTLGADSTAIEVTQPGNISHGIIFNCRVLGKLISYTSGTDEVSLSSTVLTGNTSNFGLELGSTSSPNTPFIDFHSSGNAIDYDCRIRSTGGTAVTGQGNLTYNAAQHTFTGRINPSSTEGIKGTVTNDNAQAGSIGEVISAQVTLANRVALTSDVPLTVMQVTLTPGHWNLMGQGALYCEATNTHFNRFGFSFGTTTNVLDTDNRWYNAAMGNFTTGSAGTFLQASHISTPIKLSTTTTYYMVFITGSTTGGVSAYGSMFATRVR